MKTVFFRLLFLSIGMILWGTASDAGPVLNVEDSKVAVHGYDPVMYHNNRAVKGNDGISQEYMGAVYFFSSEETRKKFVHTPEQYVPAYGGWCAWAMLDGQLVDVDPETFKIIDGKTYLFYNSFFINTLKKWNKLAEESSETELLEKADNNWVKKSLME